MYDLRRIFCFSLEFEQSPQDPRREVRQLPGMPEDVRFYVGDGTASRGRDLRVRGRCPNILVDPATGRVTDILHWEMAGFRPAWWIEVLKKIVTQYRENTEADIDLETFKQTRARDDMADYYQSVRVSSTT
ncbi:hypothetical protein VTH06DRAFT_5279 [Thermothelomyces fergusii]